MHINSGILSPGVSKNLINEAETSAKKKKNGSAHKDEKPKPGDKIRSIEFSKQSNYMGAEGSMMQVQPREGVEFAYKYGKVPESRRSGGAYRTMDGKISMSEFKKKFAKQNMMSPLKNVVFEPLNNSGYHKLSDINSSLSNQYMNMDLTINSEIGDNSKFPQSK